MHRSNPEGKSLTKFQFYRRHFCGRDLLIVLLGLTSACCSRNEKIKEQERHYLVVDASIGVIRLDNFDASKSLRILNLDGTLFHELKGFSENQTNGRPPHFVPLLVDRDNLKVMFKCKGTSATGYLVFIDDDVVKKIEKNDKLLTFYLWEDFLTSGSVSIDPLNNTIYTSPNAGSPIVRPNTDYFNPVSVKSEWLQLEWRNFGDVNTPQSGWVKWRDNNRSLIRLVFF